MEMQQMEMELDLNNSIKHNDNHSYRREIPEANISERQRKILGYVKDESMEESRDSYNVEDAESESRRSFSSLF